MKKVYIEIKNLFDDCPQARQLLEDAGFEVIENREQQKNTVADLKKILPEMDAVLTGGACRMDEEIFKICPKLKVIAKTGKGLDSFDLKKAREYGISITNTGSANANAVAEHTIALILTAMRHIHSHHTEIKAGRWTKLAGVELSGKKVGLLGFGVIPQFVAKRLSGFDVELFAYDKFPKPEIGQMLNVTYTDIDYILENCDVISMHIPALPETYHMMNKQAFAKMKKSAIFVSISRGNLVDEDALYDALINKSIAAAAMDVFEKEPVDNTNKLLKLDNVILSPHCGGTTLESIYPDCMLTSQAIIDVLKGKKPKNLVN